MEYGTSYLPKVFFKFGQQVLHFLTIPIFTFLFLILYKPFSLEERLDLAFGGFAFNSSIIASILLLVLVMTRILLWGMRNVTPIRKRVYFLWCVAETFIASLFITLYVYLMSGKIYTYIDILPIVFANIAAIVVFPYVILTLILESDILSKYSLSDADVSKMRFYDDKHNLKFVTEPRSVLYIASDENYCHIFYTEGDKVKSFMLRSTMKSIDELCSRNGILRCHRSYYINVKRIKVLRKEKDSLNTAELDVPGIEDIPITPRYYDQIVTMM